MKCPECGNTKKLLVYPMLPVEVEFEDGNDEMLDYYVPDGDDLKPCNEDMAECPNCNLAGPYHMFMEFSESSGNETSMQRFLPVLQAAVNTGE